MQQVFSCTRASRTIDPTERIVTVEITLQRHFADSESRFLATKLFSCLTARALARASASRLFARIA
ncbi:hypothetical protein XI03_01015 [Bradyrhizobium sp. CCBAU 65884]|nr:hypothetical protein [Bradyrhizobium sp. CCBAU 65884]